MPELGSDKSHHVAATANRLRMLQVDFADESAEARAEYLSEEVDRALGQIVPEQRQAFLESLMEQFPGWDSRVDVTVKKSDSVERSVTDARELQDPNFLVARLIQLAPSLSDDERRVLAQRLREVGLAAGAEQVDWPETQRAELFKTLQLDENDPAELERAVELTALLVDFASRLDQLVWNTWRAIAPKSSHRRHHGLREIMRDLLRPDRDVSADQAKDDMNRLGGLIAAITSAVRQAGRHASQYLGRFSPSEIENLARMEGGGLLTSREVKCWRKYVELAGAQNQSIIENEIKEAIANHVESLMKGR